MRLDLQSSALTAPGLALLRDAFDEAFELAAAGATRVEAISITPQEGEALRAVITSDKLDEPKVISVKGE